MTDGWGTADTGGAWTRYGTASIFSVRRSRTDAGRPGGLRPAGRAAVGRVPTATRATVKVSADKLADGGGSYVSLGGRVTGTNDYRAKVKIAPNRRPDPLPGPSGRQRRDHPGVDEPRVGVQLHRRFDAQIRLEVTGTSPTTVRAKVWLGSAAEPSSWTVSATDNYAGLQAPGSVGLTAYLSTSATNGPVNINVLDLVAQPVI